MTKRASFPLLRSFVFEATTRCNHDCLHCYNVWKNAAPYPTGELDTPDTLTLLGRMLDQSGAHLVTVTGGEPLLRPDLFQLIEYLASRGVSVNLISNGRGLDQATISRLGDQVSVYELPLLSSDRAVHDRMSGSAGAFDRVTEAIVDLKLARRTVVAAFVATRLNLPTWSSTLELCVALGVDGVMFNRFNPGGRGRLHLAELQASPAELVEALGVADRAVQAHRLSISCPIAFPPCVVDVRPFRHLTFGFCAAGTQRAYYTLDALGHLRPCNHSPTILGNLRDQALCELLSSAALERFVVGRPARCGGCAFEESCLGGCKAAAEACYGSVELMDPFLARFGARPIEQPCREFHHAAEPEE